METLLTTSKYISVCMTLIKENIVRIPMKLLAAQLVKILRVKCMSQNSSCVYSVIIRLELWPALHRVLVHTAAKCIVATYNRAERFLTQFGGDVCLKKKGGLRKHVV
jgi:hypothetical protein